MDWVFINNTCYIFRLLDNQESINATATNYCTNTNTISKSTNKTTTTTLKNANNTTNTTNTTNGYCSNGTIYQSQSSLRLTDSPHFFSSSKNNSFSYLNDLSSITLIAPIDQTIDQTIEQINEQNNEQPFANRENENSYLNENFDFGTISKEAKDFVNECFAQQSQFEQSGSFYQVFNKTKTK